MITVNMTPSFFLVRVVFYLFQYNFKPLLIKIIGFGFSSSEELCISQSLQEDNALLDLYNSSYHTHPYPIKLLMFSSAPPNVS